MSRVKDLTGNRYGHLLVIEYAGIFNKNANIHAWLCKCDCGNIKRISGANLKTGVSISCGCIKRQSERKDGHGLTNSKIYNSWRGMKERCDNPKNKRYSSYGGRGITYDEKWKTFKGFYEDMGSSHKEGLELDRIDVDGNYDKDNCRWVDQTEQCYNQRLRKDNKSGKTGVFLIKTSGKWLAYIRVNNIKIRLGVFETKDDAIVAREKAEIDYYGYNRE